jgi:hypothetical protein
MHKACLQEMTVSYDQNKKLFQLCRTTEKYFYQEQSGNPEENASVNGAGRQDFFQDFISAFIPLSKNLFEQIFKGRRKRQ